MDNEAIEKARARLAELDALYTSEPAGGLGEQVARLLELARQAEGALDRYHERSCLRYALWAAELVAAREELARLRLVAEFWSGGRCQLGGAWSDDGPEPADYVLLDEDGELMEPGLEIDGSPVVREALRRQARQLCRWMEHSSGAALGALLALVPERYELRVSVRSQGRYVACWGIAGSRDGWHSADGPTREAAIRAAIEQLLGLEPARRCCETCRHWGRDEQALAGARPCLRDPDRCRRTGDSSCPEGWEPAAERIGAGVSQAGNIIRSEGNET